MNLWTMIAIIVAIGTASEIYRARLRTGADRSEEFFKDLTHRIARLEERMANVETLLLDKEKTRKFSELEEDKG